MAALGTVYGTQWANYRLDPKTKFSPVEFQGVRRSILVDYTLPANASAGDIIGMFPPILTNVTILNVKLAWEILGSTAALEIIANTVSGIGSATSVASTDGTTIGTGLVCSAAGTTNVAATIAQGYPLSVGTDGTGLSIYVSGGCTNGAAHKIVGEIQYVQK